MKPALKIGIIFASTAAAVGLYVYTNYFRKRSPDRKARRRLDRLSTEKFGTQQKQYLDEWKKELGNKSFFLGEKISSTDLKMFGDIASIYFISNTEPIVSMINENYPTLVAWLERMKAEIATISFKQ